MVSVRSREFDVIVVGAGPAGCATGLALAGHGRTLLVDRTSVNSATIGESLIPAARAVLADLGALERVEAGGHLPYLGNRSTWGGEEIHETDFLRDPSGPGWHLDRLTFERSLRAQAREAGLELLCPAKVVMVRGGDEGWEVSIEVRGVIQEFRARVLVDATGRSARVSRMVGASRHQLDRLVAVWTYGAVERESGATAGFSYVESEANGWWYSAPVPGSSCESPRRVLAFHTDADLLPPWSRTEEGLLDAGKGLPGIGELLGQTRFHCEASLRTTAANSVQGVRPSGARWIAVGDAALSLDPLASRGLFQALYTGLMGGQACRRYLTGETDSLDRYGREVNGLHAAYGQQVAHAYGVEERWSALAFWRRRQIKKETAQLS